MHTAAACTVFAAALSGTAFAGDSQRITPDAFLSLVEGQTVHYSKNGAYYGSERFYGKGRATWQFPGANCEDGVYWTVGEEICFNYGNSSCWTVLEDAEGGRGAVSRDGFDVVIEMIDDRPLRCDGNPVS